MKTYLKKPKKPLFCKKCGKRMYLFEGIQGSGTMYDPTYTVYFTVHKC